MRPLFIVFSNLGLGGIQKKIVDITNALLKSNPDLPIYILLRRSDFFDLSDEIKNPNVTILIYSDWAKVKTPLFFTFFVLYQVWRLFPRAILSFLSAFSIPSILAKLVFFWRRIVVIVNEDHYTSGIVPHLRYSTLNHFGIQFLYPHADLIISPTRSAKHDLVVHYGVPADKVKLVPNWSRYAYNKIKNTRKIYDLIYAGRLSKTKRVHLLLKGVARIKKLKKDISLSILGDGEERNALESLAGKLGIVDNVIFMGAKRDVSVYLVKSKIFVCYSQFGAEGFPLAILEAMAMGLPVLTYKFAGATDVIANGKNGYLFHTMDEFVKKALRLLVYPRERQAIAHMAKKEAKLHYSVSNVCEYLAPLGV